MTAGDIEGHHHAVTLFESVDFGAHFFHDSHGLVTNYIALMHVRAQNFVKVKVGAANGCGCDPDNRVRGLLDGGIGDVFDAD
jgi:hypothetical protein